MKCCYSIFYQAAEVTLFPVGGAIFGFVKQEVDVLRKIGKTVTIDRVST